MIKRMKNRGDERFSLSHTHDSFRIHFSFTDDFQSVKCIPDHEMTII